MVEAPAFYLGPLEFKLTGGGEDAANTSAARGDARLMLETAADFYGDEYNVAIRPSRITEATGWRSGRKLAAVTRRATPGQMERRSDGRDGCDGAAIMSRRNPRRLVRSAT